MQALFLYGYGMGFGLYKDLNNHVPLSIRFRNFNSLDIVNSKRLMIYSCSISTNFRAHARKIK